jgi:hypothetical protein
MIELAATQEIAPSNCPLAKKNPSRFLPGVLLEKRVRRSGSEVTLGANLQ